MSLSKSKKHLMHFVRNRKKDPSSVRGSWNGIKPITKLTPTKKEKQNKIDSKYKRSSIIER
jgi:hypothetical protein